MGDATAIADLLHEAAETHHIVYRIVDGDDPDWASWYADWLLDHSELPQLLGARSRPQPPRPRARPARPRLHDRAPRGALGGLVRRAAAGALRRRLALRPDLLHRTAQRVVGVESLEELLPVLGDVDGSRGAGCHGQRRHDRAAQPDPERLVEGEAARPARPRARRARRGSRPGTRPRRRDPEAVLAMDVPDRVRHHAGEHAHGGRREEAEREERAAAGLGRAGEQRALASRAQADLLEELCPSLRGRRRRTSRRASACRGRRSSRRASRAAPACRVP